MTTREKLLWYAVIVFLSLSAAQASGIVMCCLGAVVKDCVVAGGVTFVAVLTLGIASLRFFSGGGDAGA
ncbi:MULTISPECIES: hypothetical protein [unclassified Streptomyces]|uniref:hypothetical protein n=1 Tax=unclassified Streptomyces TaxID=2593676 RepID=UPI000DD8DD49|nr:MULTISPECIES: hypothetical protein [unclassified Streptomyces]QZZ31286.1 hypothetical protein A7X85_38165 [Streptomyces sp. ST1015]